MKRNPTYRDFQEASPRELERVYKLNNKQLESAHRRVLVGAGQEDIRKAYEKFYPRNRHDA